MSEELAPAMAFGSAADDYELLRPGPPATTLDWLLPARPGHVLDVAAGTGALTRLLAERTDQVTAVEPDERMRAVLARRCPQVRVLAGRGEAIPLPDSCADAALVSSAWHWLDPARAVPEIGRVLVPGGRFGVLWTRRDNEVAWVAELDAFVLSLLGDHRPQEPLHQVVLPDGAPFTGISKTVVRSDVERSPQELVGLYTTYGFFIALAETEQRRVRTRLEDYVARHPLLAGRSSVRLPLRSMCWRATYTGEVSPLRPGGSA
jgi:SAM-dependent methyltransferase